MFRKVFRSHGEFCATQPWEVYRDIASEQMLMQLLQVIVATLTFLVCILTVWGKHSEQVVEEENVRKSFFLAKSSSSGSWSVPRHSTCMEYDGAGGDDLHQVTTDTHTGQMNKQQ